MAIMREDDRTTRYEIVGRASDLSAAGSSGILGTVGDALGDAARATGDAIGGALENKVVQTVLAPVIAPTAIVIKGTTALLAETGVAPLEQLDQAVGEVYRGEVLGGLRDNFETQIRIGAAVGGAIAGGQLAGLGATAASTPIPSLTPEAPPIALDPPAAAPAPPPLTFWAWLRSLFNL